MLALDLALRRPHACRPHAYRPDAVRTITVIGTNYCIDEHTLGVAAGLDPANYPAIWKDLGPT